MLLNDGATNMQPQAQSDPGAVLPLDPLSAVEAFPDALLFLGGDPGPCIASPGPRLLVSHLEANLDGAIRSLVFERIGQVVGDDLPQAQGIRHDGHGLVLWE